ncbi:unnamed protein product [Candidula unifasciata]|uniref:Uncharacterized protein n=1 Tax=Candidula unifasciata TaxID=100452 RepID=A0A8S3Z6V2_9EUPU|nr:unnamed protein product [Candidula unifasciata]
MDYLSVLLHCPFDPLQPSPHSFYYIVAHRLEERQQQKLLYAKTLAALVFNCVCLLCFPDQLFYFSGFSNSTFWCLPCGIIGKNCFNIYVHFFKVESCKKNFFLM